MQLTPPEKGWRVKNHPAAIAIDALTLASRAPSIVYEANGPPPSPPDCAGYFESSGCTWTETWVCPDDYMGQGHVATDDGSDGFYCCCQWDGEPPPARARTARRLAYHLGQSGSAWYTERLWLLAVARRGGNLLTEARARELRRLERAVMASLRKAAPAALEVEIWLDLSITSTLFLSNGSLAPCDGGF